MYRQIILLLLPVLVALPFTGFTQTPANLQSIPATPIEYVRVHVSPFLLKKNYTVYLSYGRSNDADQHITDEAGNKKEFKTPTGVMNYMGSLGWEFVAYEPDEDGKISSRTFIMRRLIQQPD